MCLFDGCFCFVLYFFISLSKFLLKNSSPVIGCYGKSALLIPVAVIMLQPCWQLSHLLDTSPKRGFGGGKESCGERRTLVKKCLPMTGSFISCDSYNTLDGIPPILKEEHNALKISLLNVTSIKFQLCHK